MSMRHYELKSVMLSVFLVFMLFFVLVVIICAAVQPKDPDQTDEGPGLKIIYLPDHTGMPKPVIIPD